MKEFFNSTQAITYELENGKVTKIARSRASDTHLPVLMLHRCPVSDGDGRYHLVFRLFMVSHVDIHHLLLKEFPSISDFCICNISAKYLSSFTFVSYACLTS